MAMQNSPISYAVLGNFTNKFKAYNNDLFVTQEEGKGLSTNDYTDDEKTKVENSLQTTDYETTPIDWNNELTEN